MSQTQRAFHSRGQEAPATRQIPVQKPVVITRRISKGEKLLWIMAGAVLFLLAACIVANQAKLFLVSKDVQKLQSHADTQAKTVQQLKTEKDSLSSPERIVRFAEEKLNLKLDVNKIKVLP